MRIPISTLLIASAVLLASGCASAPRADADAKATAVQAHELNPYGGRSYEIVGRLWTGYWRTAFGLSTYSKKEDAIADMQAEAARLNADALVSVSCIDLHGSTWFAGNEPAYICYAVAVQLRRNQG